MGDRLAELEAFIKIADHKTLSAAARALNLSPSAISKLIQRLENRLGVRLVNRTSRAMSLTPEGELFHREGQQALDAVTQAEQAVSVRNPEVSGVLRIGTSIQIAQFYLAQLVPRFQELHPRLDLHFVLKALPFALVEHQIDVAVFAGEQPSSSYVARRIASVRWIVCASPAYLARAGTPAHPTDLAHHHCLNYLPGADLAWPFRIDGEPYVISPTGSVRASSGDLLRVFATLGVGIARVPVAQVRNELESGALVPLLQEFEEPTPEWLYAVYQSARHLSPRAIAFLKFLDSSFRQDPHAFGP
jgi:DNA-binding transcriptional LysR family regulator